MARNMLSADNGRVVLNPRHVAYIRIEDQEKPRSATGEREFQVVAWDSQREASAKWALTPWTSHAEALRVFGQAAELITGG